MTNQEIFDKVWVHLHTQTKQAMEPGHLGQCVYRTDDGLKCAVGCLFPDSIDVSRFNCEGILRGNPPTDPLREALERIGVDEDQYGLLSDLQTVHDNPDNWDPQSGFVADEQLKSVAVRCGLKVPA